MAIKSADQITIVDITDAYSVMLTSESYTFVGETSGVVAGNSCTTQAVAYCGSNQCSAVTVNANDITCPTGISATVSNSGTAAPTITITTTATIETACEVIIPVTVDGITVNKKFSIAVAKTGSTGAAGTSVKISSTEIRYQASSNGTTTPTSTWSETVPSVSNGQYLWTRTIVTYSDGTKTTAYSVAYKGTNGTNGTNGTSVTVSSTDVTYATSTSGTTAPSSGWAATVPTVAKGSFLWTKTVVTYSDGNSTTSYSVSYMGTNGTNGTNGKDGEDGADAIHMAITTSNGSVFKNSSGSTVLTAHVYVGGVEQSITDAGVCGSYGTVKWYKGGSTTSVATAKTLTVSASDVTNSVVYTCQLE